MKKQVARVPRLMHKLPVEEGWCEGAGERGGMEEGGEGRGGGGREAGRHAGSGLVDGDVVLCERVERLL